MQPDSLKLSSQLAILKLLHKTAFSLDESVSHHFEYSTHEAFFLYLKLFPLIYMGDIARISPDLASVQTGFDRMECIAESKLLNFNVEKSGFLVFWEKTKMTGKNQATG